MAIALTKLDVLGVKLQVNEVEKLNFDIHFKNLLMKSLIGFQQKCNQQLIPPHVVPRPVHCPAKPSLELG